MSKISTHYIITVHGMGQSRKYETLQPVISRFAAAQLAEDSRKLRRDVVTLGALAGALNAHADRHWVAFSNIRKDVSSNSAGITAHAAPTGIPLSDDPKGECLRFVDLHWGDIFDEKENQHLIEPLDKWGDGIIGRLEQASMAGNANVPGWLMQVLLKTQDLIVPIQLALKVINKEAENLVFSKFLGDVQLYGEYPNLRGQAVARFHDVMRKVHQAAIKNGEEPTYSVLAHSLGSVMSLDALMYAHAKSDIRDASGKRRPEGISHLSIPFPGYDVPGFGDPNASEKAVDWIRYVRHFITIGSPIDKFLLLWRQNYRYLSETDWIGAAYADLPTADKIQHYNYCDEQDPVGHTLDELRECKGYGKLFRFRSCQAVLDESQLEKELVPARECPTTDQEGRPVRSRISDIVYRRAIFPGAAHTSYWRDTDLFRNILHNINDNNVIKYMVQDRSWAYAKILLMTYLIAPLTVVLVNSITASVLLRSHLWPIIFLAGTALVIVGWFSLEILNIQIWWRQLLRNSRNSKRNAQLRHGLLSSNLWGKWLVRIGLPLMALIHFTLFIGIGPAKYQADEIKMLQKVDTLAEIIYPLQVPLAFTESAVGSAIAILIGLVLTFQYVLGRSNYRSRSPEDRRLSVLVVVATCLIVYAALLLAVLPGEHVAPYWHPWFRPFAFITGGGFLILFLGYRLWYDNNYGDGLTKALFQDLVAALLVLVLGVYAADLFFQLLFQFEEPFGGKRRLTALAGYSGLSTVVWTYYAFRFFVGKAQLRTKKFDPMQGG